MQVDFSQIFSVPGMVGILTALGLIAGAINVYRKTSHSKEREVIWERNAGQRELRRRAEWAEIQLDWWRGWAGRLEYVVRSQLAPEQMPRREPYPIRPPEEVKENARAQAESGTDAD